MLRQTGRKSFLKPRETKMKMKVPATHIALTSHSSVEGNFFFSRGTRKNAHATATSPKDQRLALYCPVHELPLAHC